VATAVLATAPSAAWAESPESGAGGETTTEDPPTQPPESPPDEGNGGQKPSSGLSEAETSYKGAIMLRGKQEVTIESVVPGYVGDESYQQDGRYAYFSGNTLYAGVQDDQNNYVDMIAEFFWFESSIDRGSDFYVAVVKARTSPNLKDWVLERQTDGFVGAFVKDHEATLYLRAQTDTGTGENAFRWDWSIPFDNYGWDAYGNITMETKYGIGVNAEGASQKAFSFEKGGIPVEANVQAKGYFAKNYAVQAKYEVTLWRWEIIVHGSAQQIDWQLQLHNKDREKQNAYHEFFVVMQAEQGVPFKLDWLEVGGAVKKPKWWWWDEHRPMSAAVTGIVLRPPQLPPPPPPEGGGDEPPPDHGGPGDDANADPPSDDFAPEEEEGPGPAPAPAVEEGCALGAAPTGGARGWLGLIGLGAVAAMARRRARVASRGRRP
jgi:hypothetical protein